MPFFKTNTCPNCGGQPQGIALVDGIGSDGRHKGWSEYTCPCDTPPVVWPEGERYRLRRINLRQSMGTFAERLGISVVDLSQMENGRKAPDDTLLGEWRYQLDVCAGGPTDA